MDLAASLDLNGTSQKTAGRPFVNFGITRASRAVEIAFFCGRNRLFQCSRSTTTLNFSIRIATKVPARRQPDVKGREVTKRGWTCSRQQ
jgi:hypothetical protein